MKNLKNLWWSLDAAATTVMKLLTFVAVASLVFMVVGATLDIITTKVFSRPLPDLYEIVQDLNVVLCFAAIGYVQLTRRHITVDLLESRLPKKVSLGLKLSGQFLGIPVCVFFAWRSLLLALDHIATHATENALYPFPIWPFSLSIFIGYALLALGFLLTFVRDWAGAPKAEVDMLDESPL